jgi:hypothetical protein
MYRSCGSLNSGSPYDVASLDVIVAWPFITAVDEPTTASSSSGSVPPSVPCEEW